jgi:hypothetical protein
MSRENVDYEQRRRQELREEACDKIRACLRENLERERRDSNPRPPA